MTEGAQNESLNERIEGSEVVGIAEKLRLAKFRGSVLKFPNGYIREREERDSSHLVRPVGSTPNEAPASSPGLTAPRSGA